MVIGSSTGEAGEAVIRARGSGQPGIPVFKTENSPSPKEKIPDDSS